MPSRDINDCVPGLAARIPSIVEDYAALFVNVGAIIKPICTLRSTMEQLDAFKVGRIVEMVNGKPVVKSVDRKKIITTKDGIINLSKHNPTLDQPLSRAVDFGVFIGTKYIKNDKYYEPLLDLARKYDLISGWDFPGSGLSLAEIKTKDWFIDSPHMETKD